jgi:hypothetical protein
MALFVLVWPIRALAGGGPENLLLVVNPKSQTSLCIANNYIQLRKIPAENILYIPWEPIKDKTDIETFRKEILAPILRMINDRRLGNQIDMVVYSSDFPWSVDLNSDAQKFLQKERERQAALEKESGQDDKKPTKPFEWPVFLGPTGSINGLTYLWQPVLITNPAYFDLRTNHYMRLPIVEQRDARSVGFRGNRQYNARGEVVEKGGRRYFLSTMLGVTTGRGNPQSEVLAYLRRSAAADGTHPKGTIYFMRNDDIRSKKREEFSPFSTAVTELQALGVNAEILEGTVPLNKRDVQGTVMGTAAFDWKASGSKILPGAICEHFTSYGGIMTKSAGQTPLSEFLRYGAAGASGTVAEPIAMYQKFPTSTIQVHYARGCTLAEAFYQSVWCPYQLLIVGDPLCRPWADIPRVTVAGVNAGDTLHGQVKIEPAVAPDSKARAVRFELFVDGVRAAACDPGETLPLDTSALADGHHELRVVAIGLPPIESQGRQIISVRTENHGRKIEASLVGSRPWRVDRPLMIDVRSPGSIGIAAMQGTRVVGRVNGESGRIEIPPDTLGIGPVRIRVIGLGAGNLATNVAADPLTIDLQ